MKADNLTEAKDSFERSLDWQNVFMVMSRLKCSQASVMETARRLAGMGQV